jgi:hypothetical protein
MKRLTKAQREALVTMVEAGAVTRYRAQGKAFREDDYLAGAMACLFALESQDMIPASWVFGFWAGNSPCGVPQDPTFAAGVKHLDELVAAAAAVVRSNGEEDIEGHLEEHPEVVDWCVDGWAMAALIRVLKQIDPALLARE